MDNLRYGGVNRRPSPQLPAFCRTRRPITTIVQVSTLQQLLWLLWLVLSLQLSTLLLILAGPLPAPLQTMAAPARKPLSAPQLASSEAVRRDRLPSGVVASRHGAQINTVPSPFQP